MRAVIWNDTQPGPDFLTVRQGFTDTRLPDSKDKHVILVPLLGARYVVRCCIKLNCPSVEYTAAALLFSLRFVWAVGK